MTADHYEEGEIPLLRLIPLISRIIGVSGKAKEFDLTKSQLMFMTALYYRGILNMTKVSEYISSSKEQATRAVAPLVDKGIVKRFEIEDNRTHVYTELTEDGKNMMIKLRDEMHEDIDRRLQKSLSEEEIRQLTEAVRTTVSLLAKIE